MLIRLGFTVSTVVWYLTNPDKYSVADFANGAYIVRMQYGKVIRSGKFVK